jgi:hypothetical protein
MSKQKRKSQCDRVIDWVKKHGSINQWQAWDFLGISKLPSRIYDLKQRGYKIKHETQYATSRDGYKYHYTVYSFEVN